MKDAKTIDEMQSASNELESVLSRLLVIVEAYPQIRSTDAFMNLQSQIEGTENRINYERNNYNDAVRNYKNAVRQFPSSIVAGMYGFGVDKWQMFESQPGSDIAPTVSFDFSGR
jgi:LemA protein